MNVLMKKIVASVGLVALGVSSAAAAYAPGLSPMDTSKAWSITASLRGFYDDNYACWPSGSARDTFGFEVSPSVRFNLMPTEQTYLGLHYIYSGRYYAERTQTLLDPYTHKMTDNNPWDQTHQVELILNHAFSERYTLNVQDTFVIAQEPDVLTDQGGFVHPYRSLGNNVHNSGSATLQAELTRLLGVMVSYHNSIWDYENSGGNPFSPSLSGILDRMEHAVTLDTRWRALPQTTAIVGYTFGMTAYSSTEMVVGPWQLPPTYSGPFDSSIRDLYSHSIYVGAEHNFLRDVTLSVRAGATYVDYLHNEVNSDTWIPYFDANLSYNYATGSNVRVGVIHTYNSTDIIAPFNGTVTSSQYSTSAYGVLSHRLTAKLLGSASVMYQHSEFHGGAYDSQTEDFLMLGVNLTYAINPHWSAEVGYNYDLLQSDAPGREYDRNRVYLGVTASY
jgi:hypothetical protein